MYDDFVADSREQFDARDVHRIRTNTEYVYKFVRQVGGDENKAYNMLVCVSVCVCMYVHALFCTVQVDAMKWRKSFGANGMK